MCIEALALLYPVKALTYRAFRSDVGGRISLARTVYLLTCLPNPAKLLEVRIAVILNPISPMAVGVTLFALFKSDAIPYKAVISYLGSSIFA